MSVHKSLTKQQKRYFLVTAKMLITEEVTTALIAKNAQDARDKVENDLITQNFSEWDVLGQDIQSAAELIRIRELTQQEYDNYIVSH